MLRSVLALICMVIPTVCFSQKMLEEEVSYFAVLLTDAEELEKMLRADYPTYVPLQLTQIGIKPVFIEMDSITAGELYQRALIWTKAFYKNPEEVVKRAKASKMISVAGYSTYNGEGFGFMYSIRLRFKDGRYKVAFTVEQLFRYDRQLSALSCADFFSTKDGSIKPAYTNAAKALQKDINTINGILHVYLSGNKLAD